MKKILFLFIGTALLQASLFAQTKGLIISEILTNPDGNDSPFEYVELLATTSINFAATPYTVVFTDNGTATSNGWKEGGSITYAFSINTGSIAAGKVVYVGGSSMKPLSNGGTALRTINTGTTAGDAFGAKNTDGVFGNGGDNCDGVAVFNVAASSISPSTVPIDALFFGDGIGSAFKSSGAGYQLPVNDKYAGGKLQKTSFLAGDPGADDLVKASAGTFSTATNSFTTARTWSVTSSTSYNTTSITLVSGANTAPAITLATPTVSGNAPATVGLSASATDADGTIAKVEFFNGATLLATITTSPYSYNWTNVPAGTYTITAKATDNGGAATTSSAKVVTVIAAGNTAPTITLATPTVSGNAPATVGLSATVTDADGSIAKVEFYNGATLLATIITAPYNYSWTNVAAGTYTITAKATDNGGASTTSSAKVVTVSTAGNTAPTITLATPTVSGNAPATVGLSATAADANGTIAKVEFFNGANLLATIITAPYAYSWANVAAGTYTITAKATDNGGASTTSSTKTVTVNAAANLAPTLAFNTTASKFVALASGQVSCVLNNATDPVIIDGLDITVTDDNLSTLTFTMTSSKTSVVPNANFTITGTGTARKFKINPVAVGYSTITLKVTDAQGLNKSISLSLAVSAAFTTASTKDIYCTGVADGSTGIAVDANYMFIADDETNVIKLYDRNHSGLSIYQFDVNANLNLSGTEVDMEASFRSPTNPNRIYWMGSLSNSKSGEARPDRNRIFATDIVGTGANATLKFVGYYSNLRSKIIAWGDANGYKFTAKAATGIEPKRIDGFNIEGMEMGPDGTTLYLGFRAPYVGTGTNKALICPLTNFESWFGNGSPSASPVFAAPIELSLNNHGIRSLAKNAANQFLISAGSYAQDGTFELYSWNGQRTSAPVKLTATLTSLKPEGIIEVPANISVPFSIDLISDLGADILYNDGIANKDLAAPNYRKFLVSTTNVGGTGFAPIITSESYSKSSSQLPAVKISPNPVSNWVTIDFSNFTATHNILFVYNIMGELVKTVTVNKTVTSVNFGNLQAGVYFIKYAGMEKPMKIIKS